MIYFNIPWNTEKNIGKAYNDFMELLPNDDDFACFIDGDAVFLDPFFGKKLEDIIKKYPECGIFTATTNRLRCTWQRAGIWGSNDIEVHRGIAKEIWEKNGTHCTEAPRTETKQLLGGVLILIKKYVWKKVGGFKDGMLGVDNQLHISAEEYNEPIMLMTGIYLYHWYRGGNFRDKEHLLPETKKEIFIGTHERTKLINKYVIANKYDSYLEIGTQNKDNNFNHILTRIKICVDPDPLAQASFVMGSDDFFRQNKSKFDIIFIDGLHESEQVKKDIQNALLCLNGGGVILVHDCIPPNEESQRVPRGTKVWTGDVWKAIVYMRRFSDISIEILDIETGIGIIKKESSIPIEINEPTFEDYVEKRKEWFAPKKKIIYSAITGAYDKPIVHDIPEGWEYRLYTNNKTINVPGVQYVESKELSDVKLARHIKIMPWEYFDFDVCLWIDGNTVFDKNRIEELCKYDFVISTHPERDCIYDEGEAILHFRKDIPNMIHGIVDRYKKEGYPEHFGLVASHAIVRKNTHENRDFCEKWWKEVKEHSHRDQMSFNYVLWKNPIPIFLIKFKTIFRAITRHR